MRPVICIAGPTASGKSAFALDIARAMDGEIINADALQVYSDLQILSARPTKKEMGDLPHHLFGHISGSVRYSTGKWLREVELATGTPRRLSEWQAETHPVVPLRFARYCALTPPRDDLYAKIDSRYEAMLRGGGLEEAKTIFAKGFDETLPVMKAIGLRQLRSFFSGLTSLDEAVETAKRESRRFAKRQMTWFRNQPPKAEMLIAKSDHDAFLQNIVDLKL